MKEAIEHFKLDKDIKLFCVKADSFPDGIASAHEALRSKSKKLNRVHFGVSYLHDGEILYMACEALESNEPIPLGCEKFTLKSGTYISIYITDFKKQLPRIADAFDVLTNHSGIDPQGCCVEVYLPEGKDMRSAKDVRCMVRLADKG